MELFNALLAQTIDSTMGLRSTKMNCLLVNALLATGQLKSGQEYDFFFDHQFIETEKYDAKPTNKKFLGYSPGVAVINDMIVGIENRDGNTNVRFNQKETLEKNFNRLEASEIHISRARMDCGSCSEEIVDMVEAHCRHLYSCQQMLFLLRFHVCLNWMEKLLKYKKSYAPFLLSIANFFLRK